jgi:hypothetical protein
MSILNVGEVQTNLVKSTTGTTALTIDSSGRVAIPNQPFVFVTQSSNTSFTNGEKFPYNSVVDSRGLTWNTSNNNFTVPITGVYTFSMVARLEIADAGYMFFKIKVNNVDIYNNLNLIYLQNPYTLGGFQTCNATVSVKLTQNDTVHVALSHNGTSPSSTFAPQCLMSIIFNG